MLLNHDRSRLRVTLGSSAAPYGYTLATWTSGVVLINARGIPNVAAALAFMVGTILGFAFVALASNYSVRCSSSLCLNWIQFLSLVPFYPDLEKGFPSKSVRTATITTTAPAPQTTVSNDLLGATASRSYWVIPRCLRLSLPVPQGSLLASANHPLYEAPFPDSLHARWAGTESLE